MRIFGFNDGSACGYYRVKLPFEQLNLHGHQARTETAVNGGNPDGTEDIIVGERLDKPGALPTWRRWAAKSRLVYEIDDDVFNVDPANWLAWRVYQHAVPKDVALHAAQVADLITVTTEPLAQVMRQETGNQRVAVIPNFIDERLLQIERPRRDRLVVGWRGGASHGRDMAMVARPLRRFLDRNPSVDMHMIGTDFREAVKHHPRCRWTDWYDDVWSYYAAIDFDIGVVPLYPTKFAESKSHIPVLEYAALGIPVLASDAFAYRDFVLDGVTGYLIRHDHEWGRRLFELANDEAMRQEMGAKAKAHAAAFTIQRNWQQWERVYQQIL